MIFPKLDHLERKINSRYLLAILVATRARQIKEDTPRMPGVAQPHPITLALQELLERDIKIVLDDPTLGLNLCDEDIDLEALREQARAELAAVAAERAALDAGHTRRTDESEEEGEGAEPVDESEEGEEEDDETDESIAGLDSLGEPTEGMDDEDDEL